MTFVKGYVKLQECNQKSKELRSKNSPQVFDQSTSWRSWAKTQSFVVGRFLVGFWVSQQVNNIWTKHSSSCKSKKPEAAKYLVSRCLNPKHLMRRLVRVPNTYSAGVWRILAVRGKPEFSVEMRDVHFQSFPCFPNVYLPLFFLSKTIPWKVFFETRSPSQKTSNTSVDVFCGWFLMRMEISIQKIITILASHLIWEVRFVASLFSFCIEKEQSQIQDHFQQLISTKILHLRCMEKPVVNHRDFSYLSLNWKNPLQVERLVHLKNDGFPSSKSSRVPLPGEAC